MPSGKAPREQKKAWYLSKLTRKAAGAPGVGRLTCRLGCPEACRACCRAWLKRSLVMGVPDWTPEDSGEVPEEWP